MTAADSVFTFAYVRVESSVLPDIRLLGLVVVPAGRAPGNVTQDWLGLALPAVQGGVAPLVVALVVAALLSRTRFAWLGIVAGYVTMIALSTGFAVSPLTASRKTMLVALAAPVIGVVADRMPKPSHVLAPALAVAAGILSVWVFASVLEQRAGIARYGVAAGIALFVAALTWLTLRLRDDGLRTGAAGLGLGLATGIAGVLSASVGFLLAGVSIAAAAGAMLLVQVLFARDLAAGSTGALTIGVATALFAVGSLLLAQLPWYALPLLLLVPLSAGLRAPQRAPRIGRATVLAGYALIAAAVPILAAWYAARGSLF